ncbi:MAG: hypothetical protein DWQ01_20200 [Planctomycetota bacterium]|nr:MAG: hypothetical protein DWQ01_20200 [Planctomycetota bacterium]
MRIALLASFLLLAPGSLAQEGSIAIRAGRVMTNDGATLENGTILVVNGRIQAVGAADKVELPFDVLLKEYPEATVFPGFLVAHTSSGVDRANENVPIAPFLNVKDSIDPVSFYYEDELRKGVVAMGVIPGNNCVIGGLGRIVAPHGMTVEAMTVQEDMGMKISFAPRYRSSRSAHLASLRSAIDNLNADLRILGQSLLDRQAAEGDLKRAGEEVEEKPAHDGDAEDNEGGYLRFGEDFPGKALISEEDVKEVQRGLVDILNGDLNLWVYCPEPVDVVHARDWLQQHGLIEKTVLVVSPSTWKAVDVLKEMARPVVLLPSGTGNLFHVERDPVTYREKRTFVPKVFAEAGLTFSLTAASGSMGPDRLAYQAATCVREGLSRQVALNAVTKNPAAAWGMADRLGRLAEGADGTFTVLDGDPLDVRTKVLEVWVRGKKVYSRDEDLRLQRLLEGNAN